MILELKPVTLAEIKELSGSSEDKYNLEDFVKKFSKITSEKSKKMKEELAALNNVKIKEEYIMKIIDFMPKDAEELNRIFTDISLDEKETNDILNIIRNY